MPRLRESLGKFPDFLLFRDVKDSGKPLKFSDVDFPACPVYEFLPKPPSKKP